MTPPSSDRSPPCPSSSSSSSKPPVLKYRSTCDNCLRLKVKCGQERDHCARCRVSGLDCVYGISRRRGKPKSVREAAAVAAAAAAQCLDGANERPRGQSNSDCEYEYEENEGMAAQTQPQPSSELRDRNLEQNPSRCNTQSSPTLSQPPGPESDGSMLCFGNYGPLDMDMMDFLFTDIPSQQIPHAQPPSLVMGDPSPDVGLAAASNSQTYAANGTTATAGEHPAVKHAHINNMMDFRRTTSAISPPQPSPQLEQSLQAPSFGTKPSFLDLSYLSPPLTHSSTSTTDSHAPLSGLTNAPTPSEPAAKACGRRSRGRCKHESFLLEKQLMIEGLSQHQEQVPSPSPSSPGAAFKTANDVPEQGPPSLEQLLSLGASVFLPTVTSDILSCENCLSTPSTLLSFALLIEKVLALYHTFFEAYEASSSLDLLSSSASVSDPDMTARPRSHQESRRPVPPCKAAAGAKATLLGSYALSSAEQIALVKMLLGTRLNALDSLTTRLHSHTTKSPKATAKYSGESEGASHGDGDCGAMGAGMQRATQAAIEHLRWRLSCVRQGMKRSFCAEDDDVAD